MVSKLFGRLESWCQMSSGKKMISIKLNHINYNLLQLEMSDRVICPHSGACEGAVS
jgi:hypothetical protein